MLIIYCCVNQGAYDERAGQNGGGERLSKILCS